MNLQHMVPQQVSIKSHSCDPHLGPHESHFAAICGSAAMRHMKRAIVIAIGLLGGDGDLRRNTVSTKTPRGGLTLVHVYLLSRQDAQPPVPWRHTVEGAERGGLSRGLTRERFITIEPGQAMTYESV